MKMLHTERLMLSPLEETEYAFIIELLNTEGWIKFIGERNIRTKEDAVAYIQKVNNNPAIHYYTVKEKGSRVPVGLVTLIQRDYLTQPDIGFAFLPVHFGKGYAYEAARELLNDVWADEQTRQVHAVTLPHNNPSIRLVEKLGLVFDKPIEVNKETLHLYTITKT